MSSLEQEVRTLQKQVRRQRRWNIALGALVVVGGLMAATAERSVPEVVQAKKFEVVNDEGKVLVILQSHSLGGDSLGSITTRNGSGKMLVEIAGRTCGFRGNRAMTGELRIMNGTGLAAGIGSTEYGDGLIQTRNGRGQVIVEIGSSEEPPAGFEGERGGFVRTSRWTGTSTGQIP